MENLTLVHSMAGGADAAWSGLPVGAGSAPRRRTPGRWKRIPRGTAPAMPPAPLSETGSMQLPFTVSPGMTYRSNPTVSEETGKRWNTLPCPNVLVAPAGSRELVEETERGNRAMLEDAKRLQEANEDLCETEEIKVAFRAFKDKFSGFLCKLANTKPEDVRFKSDPTSDTHEEHLTAEEMEMEAASSGWPVCPQARHFAMLALEHYNNNRKQKFEMATMLLSKCFSEVDGTTFAHVNFTANSKLRASGKRLFFAEFMLIPELQVYNGVEPMRVLHVCTIDDSCFGGCHEMERDIKEPTRKDLDFDRCHTCSKRIKHPRGVQFIAGHNRTKTPYISAFAWTYRSQ